MIGLVKRKEKVKPGYKKKIQWAVDENAVKPNAKVVPVDVQNVAKRSKYLIETVVLLFWYRN